MSLGLPAETAALVGCQGDPEIVTTSDTAEHTGSFLAVLAVDDDAVVALEFEGGTTVAAHTIPAEAIRVGPFVSVTRNSGGSLWLYKA